MVYNFQQLSDALKQPVHNFTQASELLKEPVYNFQQASDALERKGKTSVPISSSLADAIARAKAL